MKIANSTKKIVTPSNPSFMQIYTWCLSYIRPYSGLFIQFLLYGILSSIILIAMPKFIQIFVDRVLPVRDMSLFFIVLGLLLSVLILMFIANARKNTLSCIIQEKTSRDLQISVFQQLRNLGFSYYEQHPVGETLTFFNTEIPAIHEIYKRYFPNIIQNVLSLIISLFFLITINAKLSLLFIPCFLLYYFSAPYFEKKAVVYIRECLDYFKELGRRQYDSLSALLELRIHSAEKWDLQRSLETNQKASQKLFMHFIYINIRAVLRRIAVYGGAILLFIYGFQFIQEHSISVGEFIAFMLLYFRSMFSITNVITLLSEQKVLVHKAEALYKFMLLNPEVLESKDFIRLPVVTGDLKLENVHFGYKSGLSVINGLNLHISPGEKIALVGTSGNGKSTLTKLISRFYDPEAGDIQLDGISIRLLSFAQLRGSVGYVFQETYLFGTTIRENILFGNPSATNDQIEAAARAAFAHDFIIELPQGYDSLVGERGNKLSGGQRQRIAIARMFIMNPAIVVLDEATSALDSRSEAEVGGALDRLLQGRTTITVAHRISTIRHYDRIVVMEAGRCSEIGKYEELMDMRGLFYQLVRGEEDRINEEQQMDQNVS